MLGTASSPTRASDIPLPFGTVLSARAHQRALINASWTDGLAIRQRSNGSDIDTFIRVCKKPPSGTSSDEPQSCIPGLASPVSKFIPSLHPLWWRDVPSSPSDSTIRIANVIVVHRRDPHLVKEIEYSASKLIPSATDGVSNTRFLCTTMSFIFGERRRSG